MENQTGLTLGEMKEFVCAFGQAAPTDLPPKVVKYYLRHKKEMAAKIREVLLNNPNTMTFPVTIDYSMSLAEMIRAGHYDSVNGNINEKNFPIKGRGKVTENLILFHLERSANTYEVLYELDSHDLKPASVEHILAFGATYSGKQKKFPIIALGSTWVPRDGCVHSLSLGVGTSFSGRNTERALHLVGHVLPWDERCRFLAINKQNTIE